MDVRITFLNGFLKEDVYRTQPQGFKDLENQGRVCKLKNSIYGLKASMKELEPQK